MSTIDYSNHFNPSVKLNSLETLVRISDTDQKSRVKNIAVFAFKELVLAWHARRAIVGMVGTVVVMGATRAFSFSRLAKIAILFAAGMGFLYSLHGVVESRSPFYSAFACYQREKVLMEAFGGKAAFDQLPILPANKVTVGHTGYLACTTPEDVKGQPITKGIDPQGRRFISFCIQDRTTQEVRVETLFQRHAGYSLWCVAGTGGSHPALSSVGINFDQYLAAAQQLREGKHPQYELVQPAPVQQ